MIKALIDPSIFAPPEQGSCLPWLTLLKRWSQALRDFDQDAVTPVMSEGSQAAMLALGGRSAIQAALDRSGLPLGASDVVQLIEAIRGRTSVPAESLELSEVIFSRLALAPDYVDSGKSELVNSFRQDLGHAAAAQQEGTSRIAAITSQAAWSEAADQVGVAGDAEAWERFGSVEEPSAQEGVISELIDLWYAPRGADETLRTCWTKLIRHPKLGVEVAYREFTSEDAEAASPLRIEIGDQFVATMRAMGYAGKAGRIKKALCAAAYVGCQRGGDLKSLEPHRYRKSAGARSKPIENSAGAKLMRGSLSTGPGAHRLMWWDGPVPVILGVVGHDDDPRFLIR